MIWFSHYLTVRGIRCENTWYGIAVGGDGPGNGGGNQNDITISDCYLKGNPYIPPPVNSRDASDLQAACPAGISMWGGNYDNITVTGCKFEETFYGLYNMAHATNFYTADCEAWGGNGAGFALSGGGGAGSGIQGGTVERWYIHDVGAWVWFGTAGGVLVNADHVNVKNCTIVGTHADVDPYGVRGNDGSGFDFESGNTQCTIEDCYIAHNQGSGIMFDGGFPNPTTGIPSDPNVSITIRNCLLYDNNTLLRTPPNAGDYAITSFDSAHNSGTVDTTGIYNNAQSLGPFGPGVGLSMSNVSEGTYCNGWIPVFGPLVTPATELTSLDVGGESNIWGVNPNGTMVKYDTATKLYTGSHWVLPPALPGLATCRQASVGSDSAAWATDTNNGIWLLNGGSWASIPGALRNVSCGRADSVWGVNQSGNVYSWTGSAWYQTGGPGTLTQVDAGPTPTDRAWGVNGSQIKRWTGSVWQTMAGTLTGISAGAGNNAWGVNGTTVWRTTDAGGTWTSPPGVLQVVSVGSDDAVWGLDPLGDIWRYPATAAARLAQFTATPARGALGAPVVFAPACETCTYAWDFGDGETSTVRSPVHAYKTAGLYTVTLQVVDGDRGDGQQIKKDFIEVVDGSAVATMVAGLGTSSSAPNPDHVRGFAYSAAAGRVVPTVADIYPYGYFNCGVNVGMGRLDTPGGVSSILTGPGPGGAYGPRVRAFTNAGVGNAKVDFPAYNTTQYGVIVSSGDVDGDGIDEILTGAGPGAAFGPQVRGWNVDGGTAGPIANLNFLAYSANAYGVNVASANFDGVHAGDEFVTGQGPGTGSNFNWSPVKRWKYTYLGGVTGYAAAPIPYSTQYGVRVGGGDVDGDGLDEFVTAPGPSPSATSLIMAYKGTTSTTPIASGTAFGLLGYGANVSVGQGIVPTVGVILAATGPDPAAVPKVKALEISGATIRPYLTPLANPIDFLPFGDLDVPSYGATVAAVPSN
ncbi:MAG: tectonin domain-containing protein [Acidobacteriota bacterium]